MNTQEQRRIVDKGLNKAVRNQGKETSMSIAFRKGANNIVKDQKKYRNLLPAKMPGDRGVNF